MYGLETQEWETIKEVLQEADTAKAILFGSRAKGDYRRGSDVDLAIIGNEREVAYRLNEETNLPYFFDVIHLQKISNKALLEHIERVGKAIL
ncbi:nucleotidyltransferase domain-containing protein [Nitratifractor sp.]|uniref:nucleotidyltransferase domain-containing protein n=1 Tax=Nitratifractor sp. TaxID=2268144 RepID=UPI0025E9C57F|nr:nucleotidyltransferase domain-containing protein [Nitratifractor sp.]